MVVLPHNQHLKDSLALVDTSQNPGFGSYPMDGMAPTLTTTTQLWCLTAGRFMETWELVALMGLDTRTLKLNNHTDPWFRKRLGLAVHVPIFWTSPHGSDGSTSTRVPGWSMIARLCLRCWCVQPGVVTRSARVDMVDDSMICHASVYTLA